MTDTASRVDRSVALRAFGRLPAWLADAMDPERVRTALSRTVPELASGRLRLVDCDPERLRAKGDQWLARYRLVVADRDGERTVVLSGELLSPERLDAAPGGTASVAEPFGAPGWAGDVPDLGLRLHTLIADEALPALPHLTEPEPARALLESEIGKAARPGIRIGGVVPHVVRYKPGSRCTVVYDLSYEDGERRPDWPALVVGKTHQGDKGVNAYAAMSALWETDLSDGRIVTIAEPLGFDSELRILVQGPVPEEETLKDRVRTAFRSGDETAMAGVREALRKTADGLVALHACGVMHGRTHTWEEEVAEVREVVARLAVSVPQLAAAAEPLLGRLEVLNDAVPAGVAGPSHHDFRPAQVLLHGERIGFIDFDGFCTAEPALDLGRFRAKLRDIGVTDKDGGPPLTGARFAERLAVLDDLCEEFLGRYQQGSPVLRERVLLWETVDLLTALLHAWTKVRTARVSPRLALLEHQVRALGL
jgi:hypothetical protein